MTRQPGYFAYSEPVLARMAPGNREMARFEQVAQAQHSYFFGPDFLHATMLVMREHPAATRQQSPVHCPEGVYFVPPSMLATIVDRSGHWQLLAALPALYRLPE